MTQRLKNTVLNKSLRQNNKKAIDYSLQQQLFLMQIHNIEADRLRKTFNRICGNDIISSSNAAQSCILQKQRDQQKTEKQAGAFNQNIKNKFDRTDLMRILNQLKFPLSRSEVDKWIWEVDDDSDGYISQNQFIMMYKRCIFDKTGLEPRNLFNLTQFLMYDVGNKGKITFQDTLQLIYVRYPKQLEKHLYQIFQQKQTTFDDHQPQMQFSQYLSQMRKTDLKRIADKETQRRTLFKIK